MLERECLDVRGSVCLDVCMHPVPTGPLLFPASLFMKGEVPREQQMSKR